MKAERFDKTKKVLDVQNLRTDFVTDYGLVKAVNGVSYHVNEQEIVAIVGESGCGKSVGLLSALQLIPVPPGKFVSGRIMFEGRDLLRLKQNGTEMRSIRGSKISMIFQEPMSSLNPGLTIGFQMTEGLMLHLKMDRKKANKKAIELLGRVGIPDAEKRMNDYAHQFSGGMLQRVMIAMSISCNPKLIIADEPTTALDVTTQAQVLELLCEMVREFRASLIIVTHNLGVVARYAQRLYVMYAGRVVESGTSKEIFSNPQHPYTIGLLGSIPRLDDSDDASLVPIKGAPPNLIDLPDSCAFYPRCSHRTDACDQSRKVEMRHVEGEHYAACHADVQVKTITELKKKDTQKRPIDKKAEPLVVIEDLKMQFPIRRGLLQRVVGHVNAIDGINLKIYPGETLGLVGESGSGKTTLGRCISRIYEPTGGKIWFEGQDIVKLPEKKRRSLTRKISMIFQDPYGSLDPRQSAASIVGDPLKIHGLVKGGKEYKERIEELFGLVGLHPSMMGRVPHEFSGGQRQRIGVARSLACDSSLIICDEPVSALDVSIQAQIINLFVELQEGISGLTYLFIAHDLSVVKHISSRIAVMYLGRIVEVTDSKTIYKDPLHPYTQSLLASIPIPDPFIEQKRDHSVLQGEIPSPLNPPAGCTFHPRCPIADQKCKEGIPSLATVRENHEVACFKA